MSTEPDFESAREHLLGIKRELEELSAISAEDRAPVALDQQSVGRLSRVDALQRQAMAQAQERKRTHQLRRVEAALRRIETGDYGYCEACGEPIAPRRLEVDPAAHLCVSCAQ